MSRFLTKLKVQDEIDGSSDGRGSWSLLDALSYYSDLLQSIVTAPAGMVTDFASVPRFPPLAFAMCGNLGHPAAVIHDLLYTTHQYPRSVADAVLREALIVCGVPKWKAWIMYFGVRIGGAVPYMADGQKQFDHVDMALKAITLRKDF